jgi:hypothetical protein
MLRKLFLITALLQFLTTGVGSAAPWPCDCWGGTDGTGTYWFLLDFLGAPLEDGDWVYTAWVGSDGEIDPPDGSGMATGDDSLLTSAEMEYSSFFYSATTWAVEDGQHPMLGDRIYCRIFDGPRSEIGPSNHYADSQLYQVVNELGENFYCRFPGDPGNGHTDTPIPGGTPVEESTSAGMPSSFTLFPNRPNPFNAATEIRYRLPGDDPVSLKIFNTLGQEVRRLVDAAQAAGEHSVIWDGRDDAGRELSSGLYFCRLQAGEYAQTVKMVLLR